MKNRAKAFFKRSVRLSNTLALLVISAVAATSMESVAFTPGETAKTGWKSTETALGLVPTAGVVGQPFIDEHGWNYGLVVQTPAGRSLWLNGKSGPVFDDFVDAHIMDAGLVFEYAFSPDGKRLAYAVRQNGQMRMVVDGKPEPPHDAVRCPLFSPDSRHLAYVIGREGTEYVQLDGAPGPVCDTVGGPIKFSPDGRRIAYGASHGQEYCMVIDQKERRDLPVGGWPVFSPDSQRLAYITKRVCIVVDGVSGPEFAADTWWGPQFSIDSRHVAYSTGTWTEQLPRHSRAFIDGQPLALPGQGTNVPNVFFSPDLKRWACTFGQRGEEQIYIDGHSGPVYDSVYGLTFSADGSHYAYQAQQREDWWMVADGRLEAETSLYGATPRFSPNGKRLAYIAGRGPKWWVMLDGKAGPKFMGLRERPSIIYATEVEVPGLTQPQFSPDSSHLTYAALRDGRWRVLIDHRPIGNLYDSIIRGGPSFRPDGSLEFLGIRKGMLCRIICKPGRS